MNLSRILFLIAFLLLTAAMQAQHEVDAIRSNPDTAMTPVRPHDSCTIAVSLLTCSPGEELYSTFGHTAIRVSDKINGTDLVFNYGTFDDSDPDFYIKFTKGIMIYALSAYPFSDFVTEYRVQGRGVIEQQLDLSCDEKHLLLDSLMTNARPENMYYAYYFREDNCTTRAKDIIKKNIRQALTFGDILPGETPSFRDLIHSYLDMGGQHWSRFGIDALLGNNLDTKVTNEQAMFLPDYLMMGFDSATIGDKFLVRSKRVVLEPEGTPSQRTISTPLVFFVALLAIVAALTLIKRRQVQKFLRAFDVLLFLSLGVLGTIIVVLWAIRVDTVCRDNFNLLWALPLHLPAAFFMIGNSKGIKRYFAVCGALYILLLAGMPFLPQEMNPAFYPLVVLAAWRCVTRARQKEIYA